MKLFDKKPKDERVVAETNRIYKAGYMILTFGILVDLYLQFSSVNGSGFSVRPVELGIFMLAQIACLVMMVRKGLADDNRYAEADVFPKILCIGQPGSRSRGGVAISRAAHAGLPKLGVRCKGVCDCHGRVLSQHHAEHRAWNLRPTIFCLLYGETPPCEDG